MESNSEMTFEDIALNIKQGAVDAFIEYKNSSNLAFKPEFVVNNHEQGQKVLSVIDRELADCEEFAISVAFITESGIVPLLQTLKDLERKGIKGRILTTDYLCFSEPKALDKLASLSNVTLKMYDSKQGMGFHTKGYIFERDGVYRILIGSSNMTQSALTVNQEWNAKIVSTGQGEFAQRICDEFDSLWNSVCSVDYDLFITEYRQKYEMVQRQRRIAAEQEPMSFETARLEPNSMQVAFTNNLKKTIERGNDRALLISATGTGKTYASAFGVRDALPRKAMEDLIGYGLQRNKDWFSKVDEDGLVLYQKYSRRDVCRILDWERDDSSTVYGYRIKHGTCPIFVTYEKKEDISETTKYEDQFIDPQLFSWMTRSRVSEDSPESREIINYNENGLRMYLFVKKSDGEGTDFYYMGRVNPVGHRETTIKDKNGKEFPIMNFKLKLDHAVRSDIFDYLTN